MLSAGLSASSKTVNWRTPKRTTNRPRKRDLNSVKATRKRWPTPNARTRSENKGNARKLTERKRKSNRMISRPKDESKKGSSK